MKKNQGITLIALVVTIIVLLILAGITLALIGGSEGILGKTTHAVDENNVAMAKEQVELALSDYQAEFFEEKYVESSNNGTKKEYILDKLKGETYTQDYRVETSDDGFVEVYEKSENPRNLVVTGVVQEDGSIKWDAVGEILAKAELVTTEKDLEQVEIRVTAKMAGGKITAIEPSEGATVKPDENNKEGNQIFIVKENGEYSFKIVASNGQSTIVKIEISNILTNNDMLSEIAKIQENGPQEIKIVKKDNAGQKETKTYPLDAITHKGDLILDGVTQVEGAALSNKVYSFGDSSDCGTASTNASRTVVVKVDGNVTIESGVTMTSITSSYGGPKGMIVYCTGTLTNNGSITMTGRGAKAPGEDVYLFKNANGTYEYVPATGAGGGARVYSGSYNSPAGGRAGGAGTNRRTGGGASGAAVQSAYSGAGGTGTSYSGGTGGGAAWYSTAGAGSANGGAGGNAAARRYQSMFSDGCGGGAGNAGGSGAIGYRWRTL